MELLQCQDPAIFQSVWERVMAGKPNPIALKSCQIPAKSPAKDNPAPKTPRPQPAQEPPLPCLGAKDQGQFLQSALVSTLETLEEFAKLEKQLPQSLKSPLQALISARKKQFNHLETAFFLLTGDTIPPKKKRDQPSPVPPDQRLRHCFRQAQVWQGKFQKSAFQTEDSCLTSLYLLLESDLKEEVHRLHQLVEGLFWLRNRR